MIVDCAHYRDGVRQGSGPLEIVMATCAGGSSCDCGNEATSVTLAFADLAPSPADLLVDGSTACFALTVSRRSAGDGCDVEWMVVEGLVGEVDYPSFLAASSGEPGWSLTVPGATLGDAIDTCDQQACGTDPPGEYEMFLGTAGPIVPGATVSAGLNPYAGVEAAYEVTAQFAQVDDACMPRLGWAAIVPP